MSDPYLDTLASTNRRGAQLPPGAVCAACGTDRHLAQCPDGRILCYGDRRAALGARPTEAHHVAGRRNIGGLTIDLRSNDHRTVTDLGSRLGLEGWPDAGDDPLLLIAHFLAGVAVLLVVVAEWLIEGGPYVRERIGADGWAGLRLCPLAA